MLSTNQRPGARSTFRFPAFPSAKPYLKLSKASISLGQKLWYPHPSIILDSKSRSFTGTQAIHASNTSESLGTECSTNNGQDIKCEAVTKPHTIRLTSDISPDIWGDTFSSFSLDNQMAETYSKEIEGMKEEVRSIIVTTNSQPIVLIDSIERLGVSYHFEKEIAEQLENIFHSSDGFEDDDLYTVALKFRIFRQHGYYISCRVFDKFMDNNGEFKEIIINDIKGMLSLYEAAHLRIHGETTLDEALAFTTAHLMSKTLQLNPALAKQVQHALEQPLHMGMQKIEARYFISIYQETNCVNETLLRFAKIDFNHGQLLYKQELYELKRWWKNHRSNLDYVRDRLVEFYFFVFALIFEPCYSVGRIEMTKAAAIVTILDDTYDSYATLEELRIFTKAMQRWDMSAAQQLPDYLSLIYEIIFNFVQDIEAEMIKQGRPYCAHLAKDIFNEVLEAQYNDAKWFLEGHTPSFDEYIENASIASNYPIFEYLSFVFVGAVADAKAFDWLQRKPKLRKAVETFARIIDDISDYEDEKKRGRVLSSISCYMKDHNIPEEDATNELNKMLENAWKDVNEECIKPNPIHKHLLARMVNLIRVAAVMYKYGDGFNHPEKTLLKDHVISMFIAPIPI